MPAVARWARRFLWKCISFARFEMAIIARCKVTSRRLGLASTTGLLMVTLCAPIAAQVEPRDKEEQVRKSAELPAVISRDPGDIVSLDLFHGAGGKANAPHPNGAYTFIKEVMGGATPKFDVEDENGIRWRVKLGTESKTETAATRLMWAMGYFVDEDYYVGEIKVSEMGELTRGREFVTLIATKGRPLEGVVQEARLERKSDSVVELGDWKWSENPFLGTREFNGLRVMMALINNWDMKRQNNSVYLVDGERRYLVSDPGSSFGKTGYWWGRTEGNVEDYVESKFVKKTTEEHVDLVMRTRPIPPMAVIVPLYLQGVQREKVARKIPRADAKWLGQKLAQLSEQQLRDCFRGAGHSPEEIEAYTRALQRRIGELNAL